MKRLEELGIGRPSTYASILSTLRDRAYVRMERDRFVPEDKGRIVTAFLTSFFRRYVEYDFTADLEEKLDEVSAGTLSWKQLLRDFWTSFHAATEETKGLKFAEVIDSLNEILGPHIFPDRDGRRRSAGLSFLRQWHAESETGKIRGVYRLLELSGVPLHAATGPG